MPINGGDPSSAVAGQLGGLRFQPWPGPGRPYFPPLRQGAGALTFAYNQPGVYYSGWWPLGWQTTLNEACVCASSDGQIDLVFNGTQLDMTMAIATSGLTMTASIDGGSYNSMTMPSSNNVWTKVNVVSGLTDGNHTATIRLGTNFWYTLGIRANAAFIVTGSSPAIVANPSTLGPYYHPGQLTACTRMDGSWRSTLDTGGISTAGWSHPSGITAIFCDSAVVFRSNATTLKLFSNLNGSTFKFYQDGVLLGSTITQANTSLRGYTTLATGLDGAWHTYQIVYNYNGNYSITFYFLGIMAIGGIVDTTYSPVRGGGIVAIGDSITQGTTGTGNDSTLSYLFRLGQATSRPVWNLGYPSVTVTEEPNTTGSWFYHEGRWTDVAYQQHLHPSDVDYIIDLGGVVDAGTANLTGPVFTNAVQNLLSNLRKTFPSATILCLGILPVNSGSSAFNTRTAFNTYKQTAVNNLADPNTIFVNTDGWINTTVGGDLNDVTHPNATGYGKVLTQLQNYVTNYVGPSGGTGKAGILTGGGM